MALIGKADQINYAILLNIHTNRPNMVNMCGYKPATNWQNFTEIYVA